MPQPLQNPNRQVSETPITDTPEASAHTASQRPLQTLQLTSTAPDVARAAALLRGGGVVAMPTETVYGLAADATNALAVECIFAAKDRPHWDPLIVHVADDAMLHRVTTGVSAVAQRLIEAFWPGPLTLLLPRHPALPPAVTAGRELVGVRMPRHPVALALLRGAETPLAAPSANRFGHVSPTSAAHVLADLGGRIDAVVDGGPCTVGVESTVIEPRADGIMLYRAGGVSAEAIASVVSVPVQVYLPASSVAPESLPSPGVGIRHYATTAPLHLVRSAAELEGLLRTGQFRKPAVLLPAGWSLQHTATLTHAWAAMDDAAGLAASLYGALRALDQPGVDVILVSLPARTDGLFAAVHDRLEKASRPK